MNPLALAGLGIGLVGTIGKMFGRGKANRDLNKLLGQDPSYEINPIATQRVSLAQSLLNSRMPGAASIEKNIYGNEANSVSNINRNATDSSQALALASGAEGQANQSFNQLGVEESQDYQRRYQNLQGAQEGLIQEGDKQYQDKLRRYSDLAQIRSTQNANRQANWQDVSNLGFGLSDFGLSGGMGKMFGSGGGGSGSAGSAGTGGFGGGGGGLNPLYPI